MRILEQCYDVGEFDLRDVLSDNIDPEAFKHAVYFDLEHYVYKKTPLGGPIVLKVADYTIAIRRNIFKKIITEEF